DVAGAVGGALEAISTGRLSQWRRLKKAVADSSDSFGLRGFYGASGGRRRPPGSLRDERRSGNLLYAEAWGRAMFRVRWASAPGLGCWAQLGILRLRERFRFAEA